MASVTKRVSMIPRMDSEAKKVKLKEWLRTKLPLAKDLSITPLEKATGGFGSPIRFFDLRWKEDGQEKTEELVIQQEPRSPPPDYNLAMQFYTMKCLHGSDVPVPKVYWLEEDRNVLGTPFFIMAKVEGEILDPQVPGQEPRGLLYEASPERRTKLWEQAIEVIAEINTLNWANLGISFLYIPKLGVTVLERQIAIYERLAKWVEVVSPSFLGSAFDWFKENKFEPKYLSLCWGDARPGNLMYRNDEVVAVLDWDMVHIGPPESDLAWFLALDWMTSDECAGLRVPRWEGLPEREEAIRHYEAVTKRNLDNFFYHEAFAMLKMGIIFSQIVKYQIVKGMPETPSAYAAPKAALRRLANMLDIEDRL